jgi:hypothetical protein
LGRFFTKTVDLLSQIKEIKIDHNSNKNRKYDQERKDDGINFQEELRLAYVEKNRSKESNELKLLIF